MAAATKSRLTESQSACDRKTRAFHAQPVSHQHPHHGERPGGEPRGEHHHEGQPGHQQEHVDDQRRQRIVVHGPAEVAGRAADQRPRDAHDPEPRHERGDAQGLLGFPRWSGRAPTWPLPGRARASAPSSAAGVRGPRRPGDPADQVSGPRRADQRHQHHAHDERSRRAAPFGCGPGFSEESRHLRPRVEEAGEDVDQPVGAEHRERDGEEDPLHEGVVLGAHGLDEQVALAGVAEDDLGEQRPREHEPERHAEAGEVGEHRVPRRVVHEHPLWRQAAGASRTARKSSPSVR